ncbi:MAG: serine/threonine-protein kinase [Polyangiales bacterium]
MNSPRFAPSVRPPLEMTEILPQDGLDDLFGQSLSPDSELGDYVIERVLGGGGGGIVYAAKHRDTGERVAIKVLRAEMAVFPAMVARFVREAEAVNQINHPNIVAIHGMYELSPGRPYYVMELLEGEDLRSLISVHGRFSPRETLALFEPVCAAVQAAHDAGIIHRDIKANNVMISNGEPRVIKLLDFGIAKMLGGEANGKGLTEPGARLGTAHNMAPEQIRSEKLDGRADIYALGVVLFQLLTGEYPFNAPDPRQIALMHLQSPPPRPSELAPVDPGIDAVVLKCLEKQPARRYANVRELMQALRTAVGEAAPEVPEDARPAVGVYAEATLSAAGELDDFAFEDVSNVLDALESHLREQGFVLPLRTSTALLGTLTVDGVNALPARRAAIERLLAALVEELDARPDAHPEVTLTLSVDQGLVQCRGDEVVGGALLDVERWTVENHFARLPSG